MMVVLFRSKLVDAPDGYDAMAEEMDALARTMPGFIDVKAFTADDGERLTVVWWESEETLKRLARGGPPPRGAADGPRALGPVTTRWTSAEVVRSKTFTRAGRLMGDRDPG